MSTWGELYFGDEVETRTGRKPTFEVLKSKINVGLLFSAHWCSPCRSFTPILADFYDAVRAKDEDALEIIFISSDRDEAAFDQYYTEMPWAAVPFASKELKQSLAAKFSVSSIPHLIILSGADGTIKDSTGRLTVADNRHSPEKALAKWL